jgi:hypothetical protein
MTNTIKRTVSGVGFVAVIVVSLLFSKFLFAALMMFIEVVMMAEFYRMTVGKQFILSQILTVFSALVLFILVFLIKAYSLPLKYLAISMLPIFVVMANSLYTKDKSEFWKHSHIYSGLLYIAIPVSLLNVIVFHNGQFNGLMLLSLFIIIWASDVGAFVFGITMGKNGKKLFPQVSPNKSWAGFFGGMLSSVLAAVILNLVGWLDFSIIYCIGMALVMDIAGVYGDLYESQWKRCFDIKDSGNIIPGHGGLLDRFDSSLMAIPASLIYMIILNLM